MAQELCEVTLANSSDFLVMCGEMHPVLKSLRQLFLDYVLFSA